MELAKVSIRETTHSSNFENHAHIIREAFSTVAVQLGLTLQNCPSHPSFITHKSLSELRDQGLIFFGLFLGEQQIGCVAVEKADTVLFFIEKLAVLPAYRHQGFGWMLVKYALDFIRNNGGQKVSIGIIDEQAILKKWYMELGFRETGKKLFPHLPFTVCFMEMTAGSDISNSQI